MSTNQIELLILAIQANTLKFTIELPIWAVIVIALLLLIPIIIKLVSSKRFKMVKLEIALGNIGKVEFAPNFEDIQIAHKIWTQLVTRKAAILFDSKNDLIVEIYDSWYSLFSEIRKLIGNIPAPLLKCKSTKEIVRIATSTLNNGLRTHLTIWQAKFRSWYDLNKDELIKITPQELQAKYPLFIELVGDMERINLQMVAYANELKKVVDN
jgi:hypothetical protein